MEKIKTVFGMSQFIVDPLAYSYDRVEKLRAAVTDIRKGHSLFAKYPLEEGESREKWRERIEPLMEKDLVRKDGESSEDHLNRLFEYKDDTFEMEYEIVQAIAKTFALTGPEKEDFRGSNLPKTRKFIYDVLYLGGIPCDEFYPKRVSGDL